MVDIGTWLWRRAVTRARVVDEGIRIIVGRLRAWLEQLCGSTYAGMLGTCTAARPSPAEPVLSRQLLLLAGSNDAVRLFGKGARGNWMMPMGSLGR